MKVDTRQEEGASVGPLLWCIFNHSCEENEVTEENDEAEENEAIAQEEEGEEEAVEERGPHDAYDVSWWCVRFQVRVFRHRSLAFVTTWVGVDLFCAPRNVLLLRCTVGGSNAFNMSTLGRPTKSVRVSSSPRLTVCPCVGEEDSSKARSGGAVA